MKRLLKKILLHKIFPMYYKHRVRLTRVENLVAFVEIRYENLTNNMKRLYDAYERDDNYKVAQGFLMLDTGMFRYISHCFSVIRLIAGAKYVFVDESSNMLAALPIREETKIVQLWHGCGAFKKFGHALDKKLTERYYNEYALVTVSSENVVDIYKRAMLQSGNVVKALGISRTDCFFDESFKVSAQERLASLNFFSEGKKCILYAPTFRGNIATAKAPEYLDLKMLAEALFNDYVILYKSHPAVRGKLEMDNRYKDFVMDVSDRFSIEDLLIVCDICITDYSSLIFEYSLFERPMVFYAYDYETYCDDRGFYYPYEDFVPGPICKTTQEVLDAILHYDSAWLDKVKEFKKRFMSSCDGHSTERIIEYLEKL